MKNFNTLNGSEKKTFQLLWENELQSAYGFQYRKFGIIPKTILETWEKKYEAYINLMKNFCETNELDFQSFKQQNDKFWLSKNKTSKSTSKVFLFVIIFAILFLLVSVILWLFF